MKKFNLKLFKKIITLQFILYIILNNFSIVYADNFTYKVFEDADLVTGAESIVVMDSDTNVVMYAKNAEDIRYPASVTKIMTALLLVEYVESTDATYDDTIVFSSEAIYAVPSDGTNIGQQPGTSLTIDQALYSLMLPSANEIANGIGEHLSGSMDEFGELMTRRAQELGCQNTQFTGASGLHDDNHYTTALDMALIMDKAIEYEKFREVAGTATYSFERVNADGEVVQVDIRNSNRLINPYSEFFYPSVVCGKTGYTSKAQHTLVTYSEINGRNIIVSILGAEKWVPYADTITLIEYFQDKYHNITISELAQYETLPVYNSETDEEFTEVTVKSLPATVTVPLTISSYDFENFSFDTDGKLYAPLEENQLVGVCSFVLNDSFIVTTDAAAVHSVAEQSSSFLSLLWNITKFILIGLLYILGIGLIVIIAVRTYNGHKRRKRMKQRRVQIRYADDPRGRRKQSRGLRSNNRTSKRGNKKNFR